MLVHAFLNDQSMLRLVTDDSPLTINILNLSYNIYTILSFYFYFFPGAGVNLNAETGLPKNEVLK